MYRYILRESCSQFDSLPLTSLTIPLDQAAAPEATVAEAAAAAARRTTSQNFTAASALGASQELDEPTFMSFSGTSFDRSSLSRSSHACLFSQRPAHSRCHPPPPPSRWFVRAH